jgi:hypothetical protein
VAVVLLLLRTCGTRDEMSSATNAMVSSMSGGTTATGEEPKSTAVPATATTSPCAVGGRQNTAGDKRVAAADSRWQQGEVTRGDNNNKFNIVSHGRCQPQMGERTARAGACGSCA